MPETGPLKQCGLSYYVVILSIFISLVVLFFDLHSPQGVAAGVPYIALVLVGLHSKNPTMVLVLAVIGSILTMVGHFYSPPGDDMRIVILNRGLALFAIWCTAIVCFMHLRALEHLEPLAITDSLTGLNNRYAMEEEMARQIEQYRRYRQPLSLIMFDIDFFKQINDNYGHMAGDYVLETIARLCLCAVRKIDMVARIGGEEFAILMPNTTDKGAGEMAERLRHLIEDSCFEYEHHDMRLTISLGVVQLRDMTMDCDAFIKAADEALYRAKRSGRNRSVIV